MSILQNIPEFVQNRDYNNVEKYFLRNKNCKTIHHFQTKLAYGVLLHEISRKLVIYYDAYPLDVNFVFYFRII